MSCTLLSCRFKWRHELFLVASVLLLALMVYFNLRILAPFERMEADKSGQPRGNLSDLYPRWIGTRALLANRSDPYSSQVTREIQIGYYGRPLDPSRPSDPKDEERFAYPLYVIFFLAPFIHLPFEIVRYAFSVLLALLSGWSVLLWPRIFHLHWHASTKLAVMFLTFSTLQVMQGVSRSQLSLLVFALLTLSASLITNGQLWWGGLLLAAATIKPQLVLLPLVLLVLWASACRARRTLLLSFTLGLVVLVVGANMVQHGWIFAFLAALCAYHQYAAGPPLQFIFPTVASWTLIFAFMALALAFFWNVRKAEPSSPEFLIALALAFALTTVVVPIGGGYNQILVLPAFLGLLANRGRLQVGGFLDPLILWSPWVVLALPWLAALIVIGCHAAGETGAILYRLPYLFAFATPFFITAAISTIGLKLRVRNPR